MSEHRPLVALLASLLACGGQPVAKRPATERPATEQPAAERPAAERPAAEQPAAPLAETPPPTGPLVELVRDVAQRCEIDAGSWDKCDSGTLRPQLDREFDRDRALGLKTYCRLLADPDPELAYLGLDQLAWQTIRLHRDVEREIFDAELIDCLQLHFERPPALLAPRLRFLAGALAGFAAGAGLEERVIPLLLAHPDEKVRSFGFDDMQRFGGVRVWPRLAPLVAEGGDDSVRAAIIENIGGDDFPADGPDHRTVCDALVGLATDRSLKIAGEAAESIRRKCPERIADLLAATRTMLQRKTLSDSYLLPLRSIVGIDSDRHPKPLRDEVCALFEQIADEPELDGDARTSALAGVSDHDEERGRRVAQKHRDDPNATVAGMARHLLVPSG